MYTSETCVLRVSRPGVLQGRGTSAVSNLVMRKRRKMLNPPCSSPNFFRMGCRLYFKISRCISWLPSGLQNTRPLRPAANELAQHRGQCPGRVHHTPVSGIRVLRFHVVLELSALGFLDNLQSSEVFDGWNECRGRVLPRPASAHSPRVAHTTCRYGSSASRRITSISSLSTVGWFCSSISGASIKSSSQSRGKVASPSLVPRRGHHGFDDVHVVADRCR